MAANSQMELACEPSGDLVPADTVRFGNRIADEVKPLYDARWRASVVRPRAHPSVPSLRVAQAETGELFFGPRGSDQRAALTVKWMSGDQASEAAHFPLLH